VPDGEREGEGIVDVGADVGVENEGEGGHRGECTAR
jgi:hypothetical protein